MARITLKIPWRYRACMFSLITLSWVSGVAFFVMNRWLTIEGEFGLEKHPAQATVLKLHAASAFLMMVSYGYLLATHVPAGYRSRRQRILGLGLVGAIGFLIVTAYGLYYVGGENFRSLIGYAHAAVGFVFPLLMAFHIITGKSRK